MYYDTIKRICDDKGISIRALEMKAGIGNGIVGKWKKSDPSMSNLKKVAEALDVPVSVIIEPQDDELYKIKKQNEELKGRLEAIQSIVEEEPQVEGAKRMLGD